MAPINSKGGLRPVHVGLIFLDGAFLFGSGANKKYFHVRLLLGKKKLGK